MEIGYLVTSLKKKNLSTSLSFFKKHENEFNEEVSLTEIYKYIVKYFDEVRIYITFLTIDMNWSPKFGFKAFFRSQDSSGIPTGQQKDTRKPSDGGSWHQARRSTWLLPLI